MEDQDEKDSAQKSRKGKTAKSKKWIHAKKAEASRAKNLSQSELFLIINARKAFTKLR